MRNIRFSARRRRFFAFNSWVGVSRAVLFCAGVKEAVVLTVLEEVPGSAEEGLGAYDREGTGGAGTRGTDEDGGTETECKR